MFIFLTNDNHYLNLLLRITIDITFLHHQMLFTLSLTSVGLATVYFFKKKTSVGSPNRIIAILIVQINSVGAQKKKDKLCSVRKTVN